MRKPRRHKPVEEWRNRRHVLGARGEAIAAAFLQRLGWSIEARRFRLGRTDLDVVARRGRMVAFVEVKTRESTACGSGIDAVNRWKQRKIARVGAWWALRHGRPDDEYRFDLIVIGGGEEPAVEHVPDAWRPETPWLFR